MAKKSGPSSFQDSGKKRGGEDDQNRGTQDEVEIIGLILAKLPVQRQLVLDRLRQAKIRHEKRAKLPAAAND